MAKRKTQRPLLPGDVCQVIGASYQGALVIVDQVRAWGVTCDAPVLTDRGPVSSVVPLRFKTAEVQFIGAAALLTPALAKARRQAVETLNALAADKAGK